MNGKSRQMPGRIIGLDPIAKSPTDESCAHRTAIYLSSVEAPFGLWSPDNLVEVARQLAHRELAGAIGYEDGIRRRSAGSAVEVNGQ